MTKSYFAMKYEELKEKFNNFFLHKKKVKALENYAEATDFPGKKYIRILKELLVDGFLDDKEEAFLNHQIEKCELDYLSWSHRTKWLKSEIRRLRMSADEADIKQLYFPIDYNKQPIQNYPIELIASKASQKVARV